jgi:predicted enzyme related to lactoylglutathione lyase
MSHFKRIEVISFDVSDWERAKKFYAETLEWPVAWADDAIGWIEYGYDGQTHIAINRHEGPLPAPAATGATPVLAVADAHKTLAALRAKGVRCDDVIEIPGVVTYAGFYDPDGNRLQFATSNEPAA